MSTRPNLGPPAEVGVVVTVVGVEAVTVAEVAGVGMVVETGAIPAEDTESDVAAGVFG